MGWFWDQHTGPESSGDQEETADIKSGGAGHPDYQNGSLHLTDYSDDHGHASWDEKGSEIEDHHITYPPS
jgi:hypothetical protein